MEKVLEGEMEGGEGGRGEVLFFAFDFFLSEPRALKHSNLKAREGLFFLFPFPSLVHCEERKSSERGCFLGGDSMYTGW